MSASVQTNSWFISWCQNQTTHIADPLPKNGKILDVIQRIFVIFSIIIPIIGLLYNFLEKPDLEEVKQASTLVPKFTNQAPPESPRPRSLQSRAAHASHRPSIEPLPAPALPFSLVSSPRAHEAPSVLSQAPTLPPFSIGARIPDSELTSFPSIRSPSLAPRRYEPYGAPTRLEANVSSRRQLTSELLPRIK